MAELPAQVLADLRQASFSTRTASMRFQSNICGNDWDHFIESWASKAYGFVAQALGPYHKQPLPVIEAVEEAYHSAGVNASFEPNTGQIRLVPSIVCNKPGTTLEKLTHELIHASLNDFPEGDPFYEEGQVDYSTWVLAHAPIWEPHSKQMVEAAEFNIKCRRERAFKTQTDYDRKRWAGGVYAALAYGPHIIARLRQKKIEGDLTW